MKIRSKKNPTLVYKEKKGSCSQSDPPANFYENPHVDLLKIFQKKKET